MIKLDLVPSSIKPVLHASQYDDGRQWECQILNDGTPYVFKEGDTVEFQLRKGDGLVVTCSVAVVPGASTVTLVSTEQMCAVYGSNLGEFKIKSEGVDIGSVNVILEVEKDPTGGDKKSASEIWDLQAQVDAAVDKSLEDLGADGIPFDNEGTDLDSKNVEDAVKEVNQKVNDKANADDVYNKGQVDELVDGIIDDSKAQDDKTYSSDKTESLVDELLPEKTVSGSIATFETEISKPMSFKAYIEAVQASGTPTPSTSIPISGWSAISIPHCGKNLFNGTNVINAYLSGAGLVKTENKTRLVYALCRPNTTFTVSKQAGLRFAVAYCDDVPTNNLQTRGMIISNSASSITITTDATARYIVAYVYHSDYDSITAEQMLATVQIEAGSSASTYESFEGNTEVINLGGTYYGGHFTQDKAGHRQFEVTHDVTTFGDNTWGSSTWGSDVAYSTTLTTAKSNNITSMLAGLKCETYSEVTPSNMYSSNADAICLNGKVVRVRDSNFATKAEWETAMQNYKIVYPIETPYIIDLPDGEPIITLNGTNNIFADSGNIEATYKESLIEYTDKALDNKANVSDVYNKTETYNKTEINNALALKADQSEFEGDVTYNKNLIVLENRTTSDKVNLTSSNGTKAFITGSNIIYCPDITVGSSVYNPKDLFVPFTVYLDFVVSSDFAQSSSVWSIYVAWKDGTKRYISSGSTSNVKKLVATYDNPIVEIYARSTNMTAGSITKICFTRTEGEQYAAYNGKSVVLPANNVALYNGINNIWSDGETIAVTIHLFDGRIASIENDVEGLISETEPIVSEFNKFELPSYYFANNYIQNKVVRINELAKAAVGNGDAFIFITDQHWTQNAKKSPALINYVYKNTHINTVFNGGDSGEGGSEAYVNLLNEAFGGKKLHATGNHDYYGSGDDSNLYYLLDMYNNDEIGSPQEHYYYYDNNQAKIRYIVLNSDGSAAYSNDQLTWFTAAMNVNNGWGIVIIVHWLFMVNWNTNACALGSVIAQPFLDAINNYSGNGEIIAVIQGHVHRDRITFTQTNGVPVIITTCDKYVTSESGGAHDIDVTRELGTTSEQAFDVYIINRDTKTIDVIRIGAKARDGIGNDPGDEVEERQVNWT